VASTPAIEVADAESEITWQIRKLPVTQLEQGDNVLAVEVHQAELDSPDMRFDLFLTGEGAEVPVNFLGMGKDPGWVLNGQYVDRVLFRNRLAFDLFQSFGEEQRYAPETKFCEMSLNGTYQGIYTLGEKIDRDDDRVNLTEGPTPGDSFIIKLGDDGGFHPNAVGYGTWKAVWPDDDPTAEPKMNQFLDQWESAVKARNEDAMWSLVDMDSAVDWVLLEEFMKNVDSYQLSVHLARDVGGKAWFVPWDLDLSMGYPYTDCSAIGWNNRSFTAPDGTIVPTTYIEAMADSPKFHARLMERWAELRQEQLSEDHILDLIAGYDATLAPAIDRNFKRWPIDKIAFKTDFEDNWLCPVDSYDEEHARVLTFIHERLQWMDANIATF
jgi:spore coat protein H